jgi:glycosyltransferase involved in cell wall biosynthesis
MHTNTPKGRPSILMIAPEPFFENRGTPISVYQRIQAFSKLGYQVDLLTYFSGKPVSIPGVRIHRIPRIPFIKEIPIGPSWIKLLLDQLMVIKAFLMLCKGRYQVIHAHEEAAYFSMTLAAIFHLRFLYDMHSSLPVQMAQSKYGRIGWVVALFRLMERWTVRAADAVITVGPDLDQIVRSIKPDVNTILIENLPLRPNGSMNGKAPRQLVENLRREGRALVVYTGSFENYQGLDMLVQSAGLVCSACPEVTFLMAGGKPVQVSGLEEKVREAKLEPYFIFTGTVSTDESLTYLNSADVLISPRTSGMSIPLKIYTYLDCGKAIVATNTEAHTRVLSEECAVLTEATPEGFAEGLIKALRDPELRDSLGKQAKSFADEKFNLTDYLSRVDSIYRTIYPSNGSLPNPENVVVKG